MADTSLSFVFNLLHLIIDFFSDFANSLFLPISDYLSRGSSDFSRWLLSILEFIGLDNFLGQFTVAGFLFSVTVTVIIIIKFFR